MKVSRRLVRELRKSFGEQDFVTFVVCTWIEGAERFAASDCSPNESVLALRIITVGHVLPRGADVSLGGDNVCIRSEISGRSF